jgi:hypothetical protein
MSVLNQMATAKAYQDGFEDGREKATPRFVYVLAQQSGLPQGKAYFDGYDKGERAEASQDRHFIN